MPIERIFQSIPEGRISESHNQAFLMSLGWSTGIDWNQLLRSKRVLIVSEAGAGKTYECQTRRRRLWDAGHAAFYIELARLAACFDIRKLLRSEEERRLDVWRASQSEVATFFLDSIDELKLTPGSFQEALKQLEREISGQLGRARVVITTRPVSFDEKLVRSLLPIPGAQEFEATGESFARLAMGSYAGGRRGNSRDDAPEWRTVALMPLSEKQIVEFAHEQGVENSAALLEDLKRRNAQDFARRPQDLIEICADWKSLRRMRTHSEQVASNVDVKLKPREDREEPADVSCETAFEGASRLALAMMLTRRFTIRLTAQAELAGEDAALDPRRVLADWNDRALRALLERPLFGFASYGRVRFHHRSVVEYLASERIRWLRQHGMSTATVKRLLFVDVDGHTYVRPSMRAVAAWLAPSESVAFETLRDHEPTVLMAEGDPGALAVGQRVQVLRAYVERFRRGGWRGTLVSPIQVRRFACRELAGELNRSWSLGIENPEVRQILLELIAAGPIEDCADIAYSVAVNEGASGDERFTAVEGMASIADPRLGALVDSMASNADHWPSEIVKSVILRRFPEQMSVALMCGILGRLNGNALLADLGQQLAERIGDRTWRLSEAEDLREELVRLAAEQLSFSGDWSPLFSAHSYLSSAIVSVCLIGLRWRRDERWLHACALAYRMTRDSDRAGTGFLGLKSVLEGFSAEDSERLFWVDDTLMQTISPEKDSRARLHRLLLGPSSIMRERDWKWIRTSISDAGRRLEDRAMLLELGLRLTPVGEHRDAHLVELAEAVQGWSGGCARLESFLGLEQVNEGEVVGLGDDLTVGEERRRREEKSRAGWIGFWHQILEEPETVFSSERRDSTVWNIWKVMRAAGGEERASDWNRPFIEAHFGRSKADRLRLILKDFWRLHRPTLRSERSEEERNAYPVLWQLGLAAIYAEAEDAQWANRLTREEAELAARYVPIELNRFPSWIDGLAIAHPEAVDVTLGTELAWELDSPVGEHWYSTLLQNIANSQPSVAALFVARLRAWLCSNHDRLSIVESPEREAVRIRRVVEFLERNGDSEVRRELLAYATEGIRGGLWLGCAGVWLPVLLRINPEAGVDALESLLQSFEDPRGTRSVTLFASLFADGHAGVQLAAGQFAPTTLLRLLRMAHSYVRRCDDVWREGVYSPDDRDRAQVARNRIEAALLRASGDDGWAAKMQMADDPLCSQYRDRIIALAEQQRAEEADVPFTDRQALELLRSGVVQPLSNEAMFDLMVERLRDIDQLLLSDVSPREAWRAISTERVLRREIARELSRACNGLYRVHQEAVTADEKETDIRMISTVSTHEAVIELKLADRRTFADLRDAIDGQLVAKYLQPETRRVGCLLVTISTEREWKHPDDGSSIEFMDVIRLLRAEARRVANARHCGLLLEVHALDLRA